MPTFVGMTSGLWRYDRGPRYGLSHERIEASVETGVKRLRRDYGANVLQNCSDNAREDAELVPALAWILNKTGTSLSESARASPRARAEENRALDPVSL